MDTTATFKQIGDLLEAGYSQTAWNLFRQTLAEANQAGYDEGYSDAQNLYDNDYPED